MGPSSKKYAGSLRHGITNKMLHLVQCGSVDQRALSDTFLGSRADTQFRDGMYQQVGETLPNGFVNKDPVGADAGLAAGTELRNHESTDRRFQIGILEDHEGGIAAEFHGHFFDRFRGLGDEEFSNLGRSGEAELPDQRMCGKNRADDGGLASNDGEEAGR